MGLLLWAAIFFLVGKGIKAITRCSHKSEKEVCGIQPSRTFIGNYDKMTTPLQNIKRPVNIAWDGDTTAIEIQYISQIKMPLDLNSPKTKDFINALKANPDLRSEFFQWVTSKIHFHADPPYLYFKAPFYTSDAVIGRIVAHLKDYLDHNGLRKDSSFMAFCIAQDMEDWFDSPDRIIKKDGAYYRIDNSTEKPYRHFETYVFRLVNEFGVSEDSIRRWLDNCPMLFDNNQVPPKLELILPPPPPMVRETHFHLEDGGTIWLSDVATEWVVALRDALQLDIEDWDDFMYNCPDLLFVIDYYFFCAQESEFNTEEVADCILKEMGTRPELFQSLVNWISPSVSELLKDLDPSKKAILREGLSHLASYLANGNYQKDLQYVNISHNEELPSDFIIIDGQIGIGRADPPFRGHEKNMFHTLQYGFDKSYFETLIKKTTKKL